MEYLDIELDGSDLQKHKLSDYKGKVLIYFYPKDNTPGCTLENKGFSDLKDDFLALGVSLIGVSPDSVKSHENFCLKQELDVLLLSDPEFELAKAFGAYGEKKNYGKTYIGLIRSTFLLEDGVIIREFKNVKATGHALRMLKEIS